MHKKNQKGDVTRAVIECREGTVARTLLLNGKPLTPEQEADERERLNEILSDPAAWQRKQQRSDIGRSYALSLVKLLPRAMLYTYTPNQPQLVGNPNPLVAIDFKSDPRFHAPSVPAEVLTGLEGRMWIDPKTSVLTRVEARILRPENFGWGGIFARLYPGGTIVLEQTDAGDGHWLYSHLEEDLTIREFLLRTRAEKETMTASDIHRMSRLVSLQEAVAMLLALPSGR